MSEKIITNIAKKGFFDNILGKKYIEKLALSKDGFTLFIDNKDKILLNFKDISFIKPSSYMDKAKSDCKLTIVMKNGSKYDIQTSSIEEKDALMKHLADYRWNDIFSRM